MSDETLELMVEEVMRLYHFGDYEQYMNEELRDKYRKIIKEDPENGCSKIIQLLRDSR